MKVEENKGRVKKRVDLESEKVETADNLQFAIRIRQNRELSVQRPRPEARDFFTLYSLLPYF